MDSGNGIAPSRWSLREYLLAAIPVSFAWSFLCPSFLPTMSFLSSSVSSSSLSTPTGSTSLLQFHSVYPSFLPLHGIHSLYTAILETPVILHAIKEIPLFREDSISHELVCLFHGITRAQRHLHSMEWPLEDSHIPLRMNLVELPRHILAALHLHGFGTFISMLPPETIYPTFRRIFFSFSQTERDSYLERIKLLGMLAWHECTPFFLLLGQAILTKRPTSSQ